MLLYPPRETLVQSPLAHFTDIKDSVREGSSLCTGSGSQGIWEGVWERGFNWTPPPPWTHHRYCSIWIALKEHCHEIHMWLCTKQKQNQNKQQRKIYMIVWVKRNKLWKYNGHTDALEWLRWKWITITKFLNTLDWHFQVYICYGSRFFNNSKIIQLCLCFFFMNELSSK